MSETTQPMQSNAGAASPAASAGRESLSYKFQRLRERLRQAIASGELAGKLPGERELARRFNANPKTLSKALTDLAAEGLLDRSIGRGTYVKGSSPGASQSGRKWLIVCDAGQENASLVQQFQRLHGESEIVTSVSALRPSFISQFNAVIDLSRSTPEAFHRNLLVRGISILLIGREPGMFKVHAVLLDKAHAASCLARDIFLAGHRRVIVVEDPSDKTVSDAVRVAAQRYAPHAAVESCTLANAAAITDRLNTAILCDGEATAQQVREMAALHTGLQRVALVAVGITNGQPPCTGIYTSANDLALAATNLMNEAQVHKPIVLWLTGTYTDRGTLHPVPEPRSTAVVA